MNLDYEEANQLYTILTCEYDKTTEDNLVNKLAGAINLVDECDKTKQENCIYINEKIDVSVKIEYRNVWPKFLREQINSGMVKLKTAHSEYVRVEIQ